MTESAPEAFFVYGTFRPPLSWTPLADSRFYPKIAACILSTLPAVLKGADLFDMGKYPAARPGRGVVFGELLRVVPEAVSLMDRIEGHPDFFYREQIRVETAQASCRVWIYWAPPHLVRRAPPIPAGDWFRRQPALHTS